MFFQIKGKEQINIGGYSDWENAKRNITFRKSVKNLQLFIDSSDFKLAGMSTTSKKYPSWSYKENCPAQRYMIITDASTRIRYFRVGYTPKLYDGHFLKLYQEELGDKFENPIIAGNQHFDYGAKNFRKIQFIVPYKAAPNRRSKTSSDDESILCKSITIHNQSLTAAKALVESLFGVIKTKFKSLATPWKEELEQQDLLMKFAVGLYNYEL
jgi:hypothetical protein